MHKLATDPASRRSQYRPSMSASWLRDRYEQLLKGSKAGGDSDALRRLVVTHGLPEESGRESSTSVSRCTLRGQVWKLLLGVRRVGAADYADLVELGPAMWTGVLVSSQFGLARGGERGQVARWDVSFL